jgi:hypothetical protein
MGVDGWMGVADADADAVARHSVHSRRVTEKKPTNGNHESVK